MATTNSTLPFSIAPPAPKRLPAPNNLSLPLSIETPFGGGGNNSRDPFLDLSASANNGQANSIEALPFWGTSPRSWDVITMAGERFPGIVEVTGRIAMRKDRKAVPGANGQRITHIGYEPAQIDIVVRLWTEEHWQSFVRLAQLIRPRANQPPPKAYDVVHPALAVYAISAMEFLDAGLPVPEGQGSGIYRVHIKALEFDAARRGKVHTNKASKAGELKNAIYNQVDQLQARKPSDTGGPNASFNPQPPSQSTPLP